MKKINQGTWKVWVGHFCANCTLLPSAASRHSVTSSLCRVCHCRYLANMCLSYVFSLPSALPVALDKQAICRVPEGKHSANYLALGILRVSRSDCFGRELGNGVAASSVSGWLMMQKINSEVFVWHIASRLSDNREMFVRHDALFWDGDGWRYSYTVTAIPC